VTTLGQLLANKLKLKDDNVQKKLHKQNLNQKLGVNVGGVKVCPHPHTLRPHPNLKNNHPHTLKLKWATNPHSKWVGV